MWQFRILCEKFVVFKAEIVSLNIHMLCAIAEAKPSKVRISITGGAFRVGFLFDEVTLEQILRRDLPFPLISYFTHAPYSSVI